MHISGIYSALAALIILVLSVRVVLRRGETRIGIGDGGDHELSKRVRAQANAVEYIPISLILLLVIEWNQTLPAIVHAFGIVLIVGRVLHGIGLSRTSKGSFGRLAGIALTYLAMIGMILLLLWQQWALATA